MSGTPVFDFAFHTRLTGGGQTFELDCRCQSQAKRLAIVGESGSGKSLTLQLLAGLLRPQAGLLFQDYALFPHLTVAQNIAFGLRHGWRTPPQKQAARLAEFWLDKMQLTALAAHYPHQISGGQRQRTALARACIANPRWLLLDEPFSALDIGLRSRMRRWLLDLQQELDIPMLLITHDPEDSEVLAQEVAHMSAGRLAHGVPD